MTSAVARRTGHGFIFVLGTGRCGSTVVQELLARHPDVGFISNVDALLADLDLRGRWNSAIYARTPSRYSRRDAAYLQRLRFTLRERMHFGPSEGYRLISRRLAPLVTAPVRDLTEDDVTPWLERRFRDFFEDRRRAQGKPVFLHKFTGWPRARFIHAVMPAARFIHVVRDGRAVASSIMQRPWWRGYLGPEGWGFGPLSAEDRTAWEATGRSFVALAGLEWKVLMAAFERARSSVPTELWTEVRYEDLIGNPRVEFGRLLSFAGIRWNDAFERAFVIQPFTSSRREAFRRDLSPDQVETLERLLRPELRRLGYVDEGVGDEAGRVERVS